MVCKRRRRPCGSHLRPAAVRIPVRMVAGAVYAYRENDGAGYAAGWVVVRKVEISIE